MATSAYGGSILCNCIHICPSVPLQYPSAAHFADHARSAARSRSEGRFVAFSWLAAVWGLKHTVASKPADQASVATPGTDAAGADRCLPSVPSIGDLLSPSSPYSLSRDSLKSSLTELVKRAGNPAKPFTPPVEQFLSRPASKDRHSLLSTYCARDVRVAAILLILHTIRMLRNSHFSDVDTRCCSPEGPAVLCSPVHRQMPSAAAPSYVSASQPGSPVSDCATLVQPETPMQLCITSVLSLSSIAFLEAGDKFPADLSSTFSTPPRPSVAEGQESKEAHLSHSQRVELAWIAAINGNYGEALRTVQGLEFMSPSAQLDLMTTPSQCLDDSTEGASVRSSSMKSILCLVALIKEPEHNCTEISAYGGSAKSPPLGCFSADMHTDAPVVLQLPCGRTELLSDGSNLEQALQGVSPYFQAITDDDFSKVASGEVPVVAPHADFGPKTQSQSSNETHSPVPTPCIPNTASRDAPEGTGECRHCGYLSVILQDASLSVLDRIYVLLQFGSPAHQTLLKSLTSREMMQNGQFLRVLFPLFGHQMLSLIPLYGLQAEFLFYCITASMDIHAGAVLGCAAAASREFYSDNPSSSFVRSFFTIASAYRNELNRLRYFGSRVSFDFVHRSLLEAGLLGDPNSDSHYGSSLIIPPPKVHLMCPQCGHDPAKKQRNMLAMGAPTLPSIHIPELNLPKVECAHCGFSPLCCVCRMPVRLPAPGVHASETLHGDENADASDDPRSDHQALVAWCATCRHGGHLPHIRAWFSGVRVVFFCDWSFPLVLPFLFLTSQTSFCAAPRCRCPCTTWDTIPLALPVSPRASSYE